MDLLASSNQTHEIYFYPESKTKKNNFFLQNKSFIAGFELRI